MRPARSDFTSQPCSSSPASKRWSMWYSWRARLFSAMVPPELLSLSLGLAMSVKLRAHCPDDGPVRGGTEDDAQEEAEVIEIRRSALVRYSPDQMFDLVNDVQAYPKRFPWCVDAQVLEQAEDVLVARLDLKYMGFRQSFTTRN